MKLASAGTRADAYSAEITKLSLQQQKDLEGMTTLRQQGVSILLWMAVNQKKIDFDWL